MPLRDARRKICLLLAGGGRLPGTQVARGLAHPAPTGIFVARSLVAACPGWLCDRRPPLSLSGPVRLQKRDEASLGDEEQSGSRLWHWVQSRL